jgi:cilia- and flagella-associated protein 57
MKNVEIDPDIKKEYENQKKYLDNSVHSLKKRLERERDIHKEEHLNIMNDNIELITEIGDLRDAVRELDSKLRTTKNTLKEKKSKLSVMNGGTLEGIDLKGPGDRSGRSAFMNDVTGGSDQQEQLNQLMRQRDAKAEYIKGLREEIEANKQQAQMLEQELSYVN